MSHKKYNESDKIFSLYRRLVSPIFLPPHHPVEELITFYDLKTPFGLMVEKSFRVFGGEISIKILSS